MGFQNWKNGSYTDIWNLSNLSRHTQVYNGNDITMAKNYTYYDLATITITDAGLYYIRGYVRDQTSSEHVTEFGIHNGATNQLYPVHTIRRHTQDFEYDAETTTVIYVNANTVFKVQARANENSIRVIGDILAVRIGA